MFAKFAALCYSPGDYGLQQKVKGGKTPPQAVGGGCGSFIVKKASPQLVLVLSLGCQRFEHNIYSYIKSVSHKRLTSNYRQELAYLLQDKTFEIKDGKIKDLETQIKQLILSYEKSLSQKTTTKK